MRVCESCGSTAPDGASFCSSCGVRLPAGDRPAAALRTERKIVTVLFADIKSSIDFVAYHDPEHAGDVLTDVVGEMGAAVRAYGGVVNQILGDGIMALFGAPLAMEDHAAQACRAALAMRRAVREKLTREVHIRVGLGAGEVVVRALTSDMTLHYGAAGEAVHFASRLEQVAEPDQILLTKPTLALVGERATVRALGPLRLKGLEEAVEAFELLGMSERRGREGWRGAETARFVGRQPELAVLQDALAGAEAGEARAVRVVAEAGCGKSRLVSEFTTTCVPEDWAVAVAEALPYRQTSYSTVTDLLRRVFDLRAEDDASLRRDKVLTGVGLRARDAEAQILPGLAGLLGLPPAPEWHGLDARERRGRTIAAAAAALHGAGQQRPTVLVVEDAHWLDPESAECVQMLPRGVGGTRLLTIATERPPDTPFTDLHFWRDCALTGLDERGARALLREVLHPGRDVTALEQLLVDHTQGNPLFIEECLRTLVDTGDLQLTAGRYRLERPVETLRIPASLRALLDTRVDRLTAVEKDVLQAAAVVGTRVRGDLLRRVSGLDGAVLGPVLDRLCRLGFLAEIGVVDAPSKRYAFRHGLIRDAAYSGILLRTRARMHAAVLEALEEANEESDADLLAEHASRAEAWAKAVRYARQAAGRALDRYANPESARFFRQALVAAEHWPDGPEKERTQLELHIRMRWPLFRLGHVRDLLPHLERAASLAGRYEDHVQLGQSYVLQSHGFWLAGKPDEAEAVAAKARALALETGDRDLEVRSLFQAALVHLTSGRVADIVAALEDVVAHIGPTPPATGRYGLDADLVITALGYIARGHAASGDFAAADRAVQRARAEARALNRRQAWIYVHVAHGVVLLGGNRAIDAVAELEAAHAACVETDIRLLRPVAAGFLALAYAEAGQPARGAALAQEAVDDAEQMGFLALQPLRLAILAQARLLCGDVDMADEAARRAAALAIEIREPGAEAYATGLRGEIARRRGEEALAGRLFRAGMDAAEGLGLRPLAVSIRQRLEQPEDRAHPWLDGVALAP